jgi:hypothetical protein
MATSHSRNFITKPDAYFAVSERQDEFELRVLIQPL